MNATWTKTETGTMSWLRPLLPLRVRIFGAVMLSPFAVAFGSALIGAIADLWHAGGTLAEVPGLLALLVCFALAALPSWALLAGRRGLVLEQVRHRLLVVDDLRVFRWTRAYPTGEIGQIAVLRQFVRTRGSRDASSRGSATVYAVRLTLDPGNRRIVIARQSRFKDARTIAGHLADCLGKTVLEV